MRFFRKKFDKFIANAILHVFLLGQIVLISLIIAFYSSVDFAVYYNLSYRRLNIYRLSLEKKRITITASTINSEILEVVKLKVNEEYSE